MGLLHVLICVAVMGSDADDVINQANLIRQRRLDRHLARSEKQVLVHLTPSGVKIFTPNRPVADKDLVDRVPATDELVIICDGVEQSVVGGKQSWKLAGNVHLIARKMVVFCHEVTVTQETEFLLFDVKGGWDADSFPPAFEDISSSDGHAFVMSERGQNEPKSLDGVITFHAGQLKQNLDTGAYLIIIKNEVPKGPKI